MAIEDLKRWQWTALGALVGPALGFMWSWSGTSVDGVRSVDASQFERDVVMRDDQSGQPFIRSIVVHPPQEAFDGGKVNVVTYKRLAKDPKSGQVGWLDRRLVAKIPYVPQIPGRVQTTDNLTIDTYLRELAKTNDNVDYSFGWWLDPKKAMLAGSVGGAVVLGGVWPFLMNLMIGAGLGKRTDPHELEAKKRKGGFDWGSLLRRSKPMAVAGGHGHATVTASDQAQLDQIASAYERSVGPTTVTGSAAPTADHPQAPVRQLTGGPVEEVKPLPKPEDDDDIEVKGEYYPVLIHHHKPKDDKAAGGQADKPKAS